MGQRSARHWMAICTVAALMAVWSWGAGGQEGRDTAMVNPTVIYSTNFDNPEIINSYDGDDESKWSIANGAYTGWAIDATPSNFPGGATHSESSNSLNYWSDKPTFGEARSPRISLGGYAKTVIRFWCNYRNTFGDGDGYSRSIHIRPEGGEVQPIEYELQTQATTVKNISCGSEGTWHEHQIGFDQSWDSVKLVFMFIHYGASGETGWAIDDLEVALPTKAIDTSYTGPLATKFSANFDGESPVVGWDLDQAGDDSPRWRTDGTPSPFWASNGMDLPDPAPAAAWSSPNSLNYNDGTDYENGKVNSGAAKSPTIDLAYATYAVLEFQCNYQTETVSAWQYDRRFLRIYRAGSKEGSDLVLEAELASDGAWIQWLDSSDTWERENAGRVKCAYMGNWHEHKIVLDPAWGTVRIEFAFDTVDQLYNTYAGWAIDDVVVRVNAPPSPVPQSGGTEVAGSTQSPSTAGGCGSVGLDLLFPLGLLWWIRRIRRLRTKVESAKSV